MTRGGRGQPLDHRTSQLEWTHKNHQSPQSTTQTLCLRALPKHSLNSSSLGTLPLPEGAVPGLKHSAEEHLPNSICPLNPPLMQLHATPSGSHHCPQRADLSTAPPLLVRSYSCHKGSPQLPCSGLSRLRDLSCPCILCPPDSPPQPPKSLLP